MFRFLCESSILLGSRIAFGDKKTADFLVGQDYDADFVGRHTNQVSSLYQAKIDAKLED